MDAEPFKSVEVNEEEGAKEMVVVEKEEKKEEEEKEDKDRPLTILIPRSSPVFQESGVNLHHI